MVVTKEILLKGDRERAQYEAAKAMAQKAGIPVGSLLVGAVDEIARRNNADERRAALAQKDRDATRAKRRGM